MEEGESSNSHSKNHSPLKNRSAGVILHPTSLPGPWGNGDLGAEAYRFIDFLAAAGQKVWQILPLGPTHADRSPYQCLSIYAGNPELVSIELLTEWGWLSDQYTPNKDSKKALLQRALNSFEETAEKQLRSEFETFMSTNAYWLKDYALYRVLKDERGDLPWYEWPVPQRDRELKALLIAQEQHAAAIQLVSFEQFVFARQWLALKAYANERGIDVFGDMPIFVAYDSADVWAQREYFSLDENGQPQVVAGVPPDYFSETGQRWGNPHYDWKKMQADDFIWWQQRIAYHLQLFDLIRIDHFRGFESYWEIPAEEETAMNGHWVKAPGEALFEILHQQFDPLPIVAEDLGIITEQVVALRKQFSLPGMKILQFAFGGDADNPYLPHNHEKNSVVYTGTHDNDTTTGWYQSLPEETVNHLHTYLGDPQEPIPWPLIRSAYASVSQLAIVPMQDLLALDSKDRMNVPGTTDDNWSWRFNWEIVPEGLAERLKQMTGMYRR